MRSLPLLFIPMLACFIIGCPERPRPQPRPKSGPPANEVAPEIDGKDVDGDTFRLSSFKGKVVLLDFSGNWCPHCVAFYPRARALVKEYRNRPFVLLGVNTDANPGEPQKSMKSGEITWRCWWDRPPNGPICSRWAVNGFPTLYLIDAKGVIRNHFEGVDPNDRAIEESVEELVKEAERAA